MGKQKTCDVKIIDSIKTAGTAFAVQKGDPLGPLLTRVIQKLKADGTMEELYNKWLKSQCVDAKNTIVPEQLQIVHFMIVLVR